MLCIETSTILGSLEKFERATGEFEVAKAPGLPAPPDFESLLHKVLFVLFLCPVEEEAELCSTPQVVTPDLPTPPTRTNWNYLPASPWRQHIHLHHWLHFFDIFSVIDF